MDQIKAFISYSSLDKVKAGRLKVRLESLCGYQVFVAHDDMPGAEVFDEKIIKAIHETDIFIPLLSVRFKQSDYADQETGCAIGVGRKIIPIKLDNLNPYGLIRKYNAIFLVDNPPRRPDQWKWSPDNSTTVALSICVICMSVRQTSRLFSKAQESLTQALCGSASFDTSNSIIRNLSHCPHSFTEDQVQRIKKSAITNNDIIGAYGRPELLSILRGKYKCSID